MVAQYISVSQSPVIFIITNCCPNSICKHLKGSCIIYTISMQPKVTFTKNSRAFDSACQYLICQIIKTVTDQALDKTQKVCVY